MGGYFSFLKRWVFLKQCVLVSSLALTVVVLGLGVMGASEPQAAPLNPAFEEYMRRLRDRRTSGFNNP